MPIIEIGFFLFDVLLAGMRGQNGGGGFFGLGSSCILGL